MADQKRLCFIKKNLSLFVHLLAALAILNVVVAAITFVLYGRARMNEQQQKEKLFLTIHYTSLGILFLTGIVFMFFMVETET